MSMRQLCDVGRSEDMITDCSIRTHLRDLFVLQLFTLTHFITNFFHRNRESDFLPRDEYIGPSNRHGELLDKEFLAICYSIDQAFPLGQIYQFWRTQDSCHRLCPRTRSNRLIRSSSN